MIGPYGDAAAFRAALETRLRRAALESRVPLDRLRKEVATQRMIARLAASEHADGWVLKGALVLLVRLDHAARATKDADTTWRYDAALLDDALDDAAGCDLGDGFEFQIGSGSRIGAETGEGGWRYSVRALLDGRLFEQFILDVNVSPDDPRPVDRLTLRRVLDFAGIDPPTIAAVPVRFHLAEKLHAYVRIYAQARLSSRTKDLYDMLVMARSLPLPASDELHDAVTATFELRATSLPTTLPVPPAQWQRTWAGYVRDYSIPWTNLDSAYAALVQLWAPVLAPPARPQTWDVEEWTWR